MEIMYALLALISFLLIFIAHYAKRVSEKEPVRIIQEVKAEPKKEEKPKAKPKKAKKTTKSKKEEVNPPRNYGEVWKPMVEPIPYAKHRIDVDRHEISNMGRVWDKKREALLDITKDKKSSELRVSLNTTTASYRRRVLKTLVATTFIGIQNSKNYIVVNCDGNPNNCAASNLRWQKSSKGRKAAM